MESTMDGEKERDTNVEKERENGTRLRERRDEIN